MEKSVAVVAGIVSLLVALLVTVAGNPATTLHLLVPLLIVVGAFFLFRMGRTGLIAAIVQWLAAVVAFLTFAPIKLDSAVKLDLTGFSSVLGWKFILISGLLPATAFVVVAFDRLPRWSALTGAVGAGLCLVMLVLAPADQLGAPFARNLVWILPTALLALVSSVPAWNYLVRPQVAGTGTFLVSTRGGSSDRPSGAQAPRPPSRPVAPPARPPVPPPAKPPVRPPPPKPPARPPPRP